jgi:hypothetical protein
MARGLGAHHRPAIAEANGPTGARATREDVPHGESLQGSLHQHQVAWELSRNTPSAIGVALMVPQPRPYFALDRSRPASDVRCARRWIHRPFDVFLNALEK